MSSIQVQTDLDGLSEEISKMEAMDLEAHNERKEELDWIVEQLCGMSDENFREFIHSIKLQRKANSHRRRMSPNA